MSGSRDEAPLSPLLLVAEQVQPWRLNLRFHAKDLPEPVRRALLAALSGACMHSICCVTEEPLSSNRAPSPTVQGSTQLDLAHDYLHQSPDELCSIVKFSGFFGRDNDSVPTYMTNDGLEQNTADGVHAWDEAEAPTVAHTHLGLPLAVFV